MVGANTEFARVGVNACAYAEEGQVRAVKVRQEFRAYIQPDFLLETRETIGAQVPLRVCARAGSEPYLIQRPKRVPCIFFRQTFHLPLLWLRPQPMLCFLRRLSYGVRLIIAKLLRNSSTDRIFSGVLGVAPVAMLR